MKQILITLSFAILSLAVASCKKADDLKPVDTIPGEYKITGTASYTIDGAISSNPLSGTLSVYAGNQSGSYYFLERYNSAELGYLTTHDNGKFTVQQVPDFVLYNQYKFAAYQTGSGSTGTNSITFYRTIDATVGGIITPGGIDQYITKPVRKYVSIVATK